MRIGIIGSGNVGATAARLFAGAGHDVPGSEIYTKELTADDARELRAR
jgi:predicted dinucleotide-binding enzyme